MTGQVVWLGCTVLCVLLVSITRAVHGVNAAAQQADGLALAGRTRELMERPVAKVMCDDRVIWLWVLLLCWTGVFAARSYGYEAATAEVIGAGFGLAAVVTTGAGLIAAGLIWRRSRDRTRLGRAVRSITGRFAALVATGALACLLWTWWAEVGAAS